MREWSRRRRSCCRSGSPNRLVVFTHDGPCWVAVGADGKRLTPSLIAGNPRSRPRARCGRCRSPRGSRPPCSKLLGLDRNGAVHGARFHVDDGSFELLSAQIATTQGGYLATAFTGPSTVVAVPPTDRLARLRR